MTTSELSTHGLTSQGRFQRGAPIQSPEGTSKQGSAAVAAALVAEHAAAIGDESLKEYAAELVAEADGVGAPVPVVEGLNKKGDSDAYGIPEAGTGGPVPLTAQFPRVPAGGPAVLEEEEEEQEVEEEIVEPLAELTALPAHIAEALEEEDEDDSWADDEYEDEPVVAPEAPESREGLLHSAVAEELGYSDFELQTDQRVQRAVAEVVQSRRRTQHVEAQKVKAASKSRLVEAAEHFPYVPKPRLKELAGSLTSNREFYRQVKAENDQIAGVVEQRLSAERQSLAAEREQVATERAQAQRAMWGNEIPAAAGPQPSDFETQRKMAISRERKGLMGVIAERRRRGDIRL